jgi:hypothetical protein
VDFSVKGMANNATTKAARQAARAAVTAAHEELARRTRANADDLTRYFTARDRIDGIDEKLRDKITALQEQADERRNQERSKCAVAVRTMRDRGEDVAEIAKLAGTSAKNVRELIELAEKEHERGNGEVPTLAKTNGDRADESAHDGPSERTTPTP